MSFDTQEEYEDEIDRMRKRNMERRRHKRIREEKTFDEDTLEFVDVFEEEKEASEPLKKKTIRKKSLWRRLRMYMAVLAVVLAAGIGISSFFRNTGNEWWTVAAFGVDSRDGNTGKGALSDVEILAAVNKRSGEIRLLSVFRDSYLQIDDEGTLNKINEAYFLGSHEQAVRAVEMNFDIVVDDYATFNWKAVVDAINVLGGVDLEITDSEFAYINAFITETVNSTGVGSVQLEHAGMNHLDGVQAVAYSRLRLMDTDFQRTERQRRVLGLVMEKAKQADVRTLTTLVKTVFPQISTSIGADDLLSMVTRPKKYYISQTSGFPFSHVEKKVGKKACVIPATLESNVIQLHAFLYDDEQYVPSETVRRISGQIAEVGGVKEVGKDTESGKNAGASSAAAQTSGAIGMDKPAAGEVSTEAVLLQEAAPQEENEAESTVSETDISEDTAGDETVDTFVDSASDEGGGAESGSEAVQEQETIVPKPEIENGQDVIGRLEAPGQNVAETSKQQGPGIPQ